jgi:hypothetical protein
LLCWDVITGLFVKARRTFFFNKPKRLIFILGTSRSGKTTLAKIVEKKYNFKLISEDEIAHRFANHFPELKISTSTPVNLYKFMIPYIKTLLEENPESYFVVEGNLPILLAYKNFKKRIISLYGIGYPNTTPKEFLKDVRKFETQDDWTRDCSDDYLLEFFLMTINHAKKVRNNCRKRGFKFFDVSLNRNEKHHELLNDIECSLIKVGVIV